MPPKRVLVSYGVDIDAVAGWLGSYGGEDSVSDISRGIFAAEVGVPRMLKMFEKKNIRATWFIPGHTLESFPTECRAIVDAGHEVGLHGYSHENPNAMSLQQQKDILEKTFTQLTEFVGKPPTGSVAPWWETSEEGAELLLQYGIEYDHSMHHHDSQCYWLRTGDKWTKIDYKAKAEAWMKPLVRGKEVALVEVPANWYQDDLPPMMFIKKSANSHGWVNPRDIEEMWKDMFSWLYENEEDFVFPITVHPDVSGRPQVLAMHERFIDWVNTHEGVQWMTMDEINKDFRSRNPPPAAA
ncbi:probable polysaccharide deacetylase family protein [Ustilago trichophora]|uniref:Probable polysaccharide deacetylase family protein n=1 Tax=Ustilago trichophora TaxID=86804 RepID=A0A5C3EFW5_9BASI|nr:probable polysaccharide deacetylase family protein [Ustilago trichophora]